MAKTAAARGNDKRQCGEQASEHDGCNDNAGRPDDTRRKLQRQNAGVVHRGHADADDRTTERNRRSTATGKRDAETDGRNRDRKNQRQQCDGKAVSGAHAGIVGQHRYEVGCPDSAAADRRIEPDPDHARAPLRCLRAIEQADSDRAREQADGGTQHDQPPIMFANEAIQDLLHDRPSIGL